MKKYKEWLTNEIEIMESETSENYPHEQMVEREVVLNLIDQLDEPETLSIDKEQLIKRIENYIPLHDKTVGDVVDGILEIVKQLPEMEVLSPKWIDDNTQLDMNPTSRVVPAFLLENILVPKQESPVIPKYVAEYLDFAKKEASLIEVLVIVSVGWPTMKKEFDWISENDETFARAWLDGYEVEEVDRAYKDGYEKGREHGFYKGYREGLGYKGSESEALSQEDSINIVLDDLKEHIKEQQSLSQNVGMAHTSAGNDTHYRQYDYVLECIGEYEPSDDLQNLLVPKQELPVIPRFVADWIDEMKQDERPFYSVMSTLMNKTNHEWAVWKSANMNFSEIVAQAWLDGFTVEEEQKYYVLTSSNKILLIKDDGEVRETYQAYSWVKKRDKEHYQLTEQEIRDYDEQRYWPFAVPVEEVEEE